MESEFEPSRIPDGSALYLHVPFCASICDFCAFDKALPSPGDWGIYREAFHSEWKSLQFEGKVRSIFWGGGTPGLLKASDIEKIAAPFQSVAEDGAEWTVELTPLCPTTEKLAAWKNVGVNRLSLGVQSFRPRLLEAMGRPYSTEKIPKIVEKIRGAGFQNLNLVIAFPGQTEDELMQDLEQSIALAPDHLSVYCLTLEEDTALYTRLTRSGHVVDLEQEARLYETAWSFLEEHGYHQYEISNFARKGFQCEHHLNVWRMGNWRGLGPSAASQLGEYRFQNPHELRKWADFVPLSEGDTYAGMERITGDSRILEKFAFGLRMNEGVSKECLAGISSKELDRLDSFVEQLKSERYLELIGDRYVLTLTGRLLADEISRWILS